MKYYQIRFQFRPVSTAAVELLPALLVDCGFESFEDSDEGITGYVQQDQWDEEALQQVLRCFPLPDTVVTYEQQEAEDRNWNEQWEQEGFDPIVIDEALVIHDGRHLSSVPYPISIEIDAHQAFGTGNHQTTRMIVSELRAMDLHDRRVLDCGCGTGILSIAALKMGAREAVGYDIDEWSADNARHNAVINQVDDRFTSLLGDVAVLEQVEGTFDVVLANINRNILLADMPMFRQKMRTGALLVLSGFYTADIPLLEEKALTLGMNKKAQRADDDWACMVLQLT